MKWIFFLFLMTTFSASADIFKIDGELLEFKTQEGMLLRGCDKGCEALSTIKLHKLIDLKKARAGEKFEGSVGSDVCRLVYKATSVLGLDQSKDQFAFCVFKDSSAVEINSLGDYLRQHKVVRHQ